MPDINETQQEWKGFHRRKEMEEGTYLINGENMENLVAEN